MSPVPMCLLTHLFILAHSLLSISFLPFPFVSSFPPLFLIDFPFFPQSSVCCLQFRGGENTQEEAQPEFFM